MSEMKKTESFVVHGVRYPDGFVEWYGVRSFAKAEWRREFIARWLDDVKYAHMPTDVPPVFIQKTVEKFESEVTEMIFDE